MAALIPKYRPVLSAENITHMIKLLKADGSKESLLVLSQLVMYEYKINNSALSPAYIEKEKQSLGESLGFESPTQSSKVGETPEELYIRWSKNPAALSIKEIEIVQQHRYLNDLMNSEEEAQYETDNILPTSSTDKGN